MNPLDRIAQLTERAENAEKQADMALSNCESAQRTVAELREENRQLREELDAYKFANRQLARSVDELRAQVETARQELAREAGTIAKLAKDKRELLRAVRDLLDFADPGSVPGDITIEKWKNAVSTYSRHA